MAKVNLSYELAWFGCPAEGGPYLQTRCGFIDLSWEDRPLSQNYALLDVVQVIIEFNIRQNSFERPPIQDLVGPLTHHFALTVL